MSDKLTENEDARPVSDLERHANRRQSSILVEFLDFLLHNKKWWLTPIIIVLLLLGALILVSSTGVAPFIYTLF